MDECKKTKRAQLSTKKRKLTDVAEEKRVTRFRPAPSSQVRQRISRALEQRLYLLDHKDESTGECLRRDFAVMGSTGNAYNVSIQQRPSCTCPDGMKGNICKHLLFVYLKVLRLPVDSSMVYQTSLLQSELREAFQKAPRTCCASDQEQEDVALAGVMAHQVARKAYKKGLAEGESEAGGADDDEREKADIRGADDDCPICFESLDAGNKEALSVCGVCRRAVHKDCFGHWSKTKQQSGDRVSCVYCRSEWLPAANGAAQGVTMDGSYMNFAALQGVSRERDTSTYSEWFNRRYQGD